MKFRTHRNKKNQVADQIVTGVTSEQWSYIALRGPTRGCRILSLVWLQISANCVSKLST
ncbi:unnamed protein product [Brassica oleracea var. botrytis]|uniref:(rape) hypothetical protein n=1 Tax=Brassica napus TaxID=3708 RepID=A0A816JJE8_BRANA|nr:unnamed protein product [Brassica napus]